MFSGSSVAVVTPMQLDGTVDFGCLERLVDFHVAEGSDALVVAGTTGESATLSKADSGTTMSSSVMNPSSVLVLTTSWLQPLTCRFAYTLANRRVGHPVSRSAPEQTPR